MVRPSVYTDSACVICVGRSVSTTQQTMAWGLGWGLDLSTQGDTVLSHFGDNGEMKAYVAASTREQRAVVYFANGANGLSIADTITAVILGRRAPGIAWAGHEQHDAPSRRLLREVLAWGERAVTSLHAGRPELATASMGGPTAPLTEREFVAFAQRLRNRGRDTLAASVLRAAVTWHPRSASAHVALGDASRRAGGTAVAIAAYRTGLELAPGNAGAPLALRRLTTPVRVTAALLESYVGTYDTPLGVLIVSRRGSQLLGKLDEQSPAELFADSPIPVSLESGTPTVEFVRDGEGPVFEVVIRAGGREFRGKKR